MTTPFIHQITNPMFSKNTYIRRREELKKHFTSGLLLLMGNDECGMNYEGNAYHFRQDSSFLYYFGINAPGFYAVLDLDYGTETLYGTDYSIDDIVWMGPVPRVSELAEKAGVGNHADPGQLQEVLGRGRQVHFLPPYRPEHTLKLMRLTGLTPQQVAAGASLELIRAIARQRNIKSTEEILEIEAAVEITVRMHQAAMRHARPGMTEAMVAAKVTEAALAANMQLAFPVIATINGQTLHNHYHGNTLKEGRLFLLDAGAETPMGYAGDMSSTFPVGRHFTPEQSDIYQICLDAHEHAISLLRPGIPFREIHLSAATIIFDGLKSLGFTRGDTAEAVQAGAHALFFPCGLGHLMGLDVHDMENLGEQWVGYGGEPKSTQFGLKSLRLGMKLQEGNVLTIEPGIYFIPQLIDLWKKNNTHAEFLNYARINQFRDFGGLRNEEDILITADGYRILGPPLAKTIAEVEAERAIAFG